ncbi:Ribosomal protein L1p/L10e family [Prunus dulcis]|uniref:Ribosomal protein L1p/L10e family n=1 Tax=Prunus dulcis TaxID=3755 RepID=A0A4Y1RQA3_PRUDU|nr:Ribosomal protein L1p/L10e family [Prunus dulcis]
MTPSQLESLWQDAGDRSQPDPQILAAGMLQINTYMSINLWDFNPYNLLRMRRAQYQH